MPGALAVGLHRRGVLSRPAGGTPTLDTATNWWVCKNTATYYASGSDALLDKVAANNLQRGPTTGSDTQDPAFGNDATYEHLTFDGSNDYLRSASAFSPTGSFTVLVVARRIGSGSGVLFSTRSGAAASNSGVDLLYQSTGGYNGVRTRATDGTTYVDPTTSEDVAWNTGTINAVAAIRSGSTIRVAVDGTTKDAAATIGTTLTQGVNGSWGSRDGSTSLAINAAMYGMAVWNGTAESTSTLSAARSELLSLAAL